MKVRAIKCSKCKDTIYSRARHDFHECSCGSIFVDGGPELERFSWSPDMEIPEPFDLEIGDVTKQDLYNDWNHLRDKYGVIKEQ